LLEELGIEYDAWVVNIGFGEQFNKASPALGLERVRVKVRLRVSVRVRVRVRVLGF
jgi:hypothetical protein